VRAIFISYRRHDSEGEAGRLFDDLVEQFDEKSVFMDVAAVTVGRDFRKAIDESVASCGVLLAVIGPGWLDANNEKGERRLDDPADFVRLETASALGRDIPVIPVLVHGAKMPRADQLPDDLKNLAYRNCAELTHVRWKSDIKILVRALRALLGDPRDIVPGGRNHPTTAISTLEIKELLKTARPPGRDTRDADTAKEGETWSGPTGDIARTSHTPRPTSKPAIAPPTGTVAETKSELDSVCGGKLDPAAIARITRELAQYIGPIAEIVVTQAAKRCTTISELRRSVAEEIDGSADRTRFLDSCRSS
jgi:TIR domain